MKAYPPIFSPAQAKALTDDEEEALLEFIAAINDQLANYDGTPILVDVPESSNRVRASLIERIRNAGWQMASESTVSALTGAQTSAGSPYRSSGTYNVATSTKITLTERK